MLNHKTLVKISNNLGIDKVGVSLADAIQSDKLIKWLDNAYHGQMNYMARNREKRLDPRELLPGARSVISIFVNYHQQDQIPHLDGVISKYARGLDYHLVLKDLLHDLAGKLFAEQIADLSRSARARVYRVFVDSAPVMEKHWAVAAGIGWQGKHSNVITREFGSWGFLGEIITTETFDHYDMAIPDLCGTCVACIDACPTSAIVEPYLVDGSKCISYATIELEPEVSIPDDIRAGMDDWIFGCDICQDVCPWNRFEKSSGIKAFEPVEGFRSGRLPEFHQMDEDGFQRQFGKTPLERPGLLGMLRNQSAKR
ncbi:MAG: tRNA epoxyqueuosine(34) reductase QueG [Candidatus Marinimicrobia bacterium]|nr:tRNA epoxyqueuosine(34) reductase QueG [Candidatus Neomarinimicrobiota bacterium]